MSRYHFFTKEGNFNDLSRGEAGVGDDTGMQVFIEQCSHQDPPIVNVVVVVFLDYLDYNARWLLQGDRVQLYKDTKKREHKIYLQLNSTIAIWQGLSPKTPESES